MVLLSLTLGFAGYCIYYHFATMPAEKLAAAPDAELQWLHREFALTDEQFTRIAEMHAAYKPKCDAMCANLMTAHTKLETLLRASNGTVTPELKAALADISAIELDCQQGMLEHVFAVSKVMPPASGERYRQMMEAQILQRGPHYTHLSPAAK